MRESKLTTLPRISYMSVNLAQSHSQSSATRRAFRLPLQWQRKLSLPPANVTIAAQAVVVYRRLSMSARLDPWGSGAVEIATSWGSAGLAQAHHKKNPRIPENSLPPDLVQLRSTLPV